MRQVLRVILSAAFVLVLAVPGFAQVTTSTLVGLVRDAQNAVIPGATVVATHEGTGVTREGVSDGNGEFVFSALPAGPYTVKVELTGFKALQNQGMQLGAGQTVRQTFTLEVGALAETVTVAGDAPLIDTAASLQTDSLGSQEVRELPVNRRNLTNLMSLTAGVNVNGDGMVQMNGVAAGGTGLTVDGTEANSNPEARSLAQYGGQNQISVMSLDSISEVQIVKGVLPAEYGGVAGGQINVISRSGTNNFHGTAFYSGQNEKFNARSFFSTTREARRQIQSVRRHARWSRYSATRHSSSRRMKGIKRRCSATSIRLCRISRPGRDPPGAAVSRDVSRARHPQSSDRTCCLWSGRGQCAGGHAGADLASARAQRTISSPRRIYPS